MDISPAQLEKLSNAITEVGAPSEDGLSVLTGVVVIAEWDTIENGLQLTTVKYDPRESGPLVPWRAYGMIAAAGSGSSG